MVGVLSRLAFSPSTSTNSTAGTGSACTLSKEIVFNALSKEIVFNDHKPK